jgi:hypothetical protein
MLSNAELDRLIAELRTHPLAEGELREIKEGVYVSLSQSQPEGLENDFCLNAGGRMYFFFRKAAAFTRLAAKLTSGPPTAPQTTRSPEKKGSE